MHAQLELGYVLGVGTVVVLHTLSLVASSVQRRLRLARAHHHQEQL